MFTQGIQADIAVRGQSPQSTEGADCSEKLYDSTVPVTWPDSTGIHMCIRHMLMACLCRAANKQASIAVRKQPCRTQDKKAERLRDLKAERLRG